MTSPSPRPAKSHYKMARRETSIPEEDSDSDVSDETEAENSVPVTPAPRRPSRISFSKLWKFSVLSVSPSPRVSTIDGPMGLYARDDLRQSLRTEKAKLRMLCAAFSILLVIAVVSTTLTVYLATRGAPIPYCTHDDSGHYKLRDAQDPDVFDDISMAEYESVTQFLLNYIHLDLTPYANASLTDSYIYLIELHLPNKAETLKYLHGSGMRPERKAKAVIYRGSVDPPIVEEYLVFPLPEPTEVIQYMEPAYTSHPVPYNIRPIDAIEYNHLYMDIVSGLTEQLYPLLMESYNLCYHNCTKNQNCMEIIDVAPWTREEGGRMTWMSSFRSVDGFYLYPLGLDFLVQHESTNTDEWAVEMIVYNGQTFTNASELMESYRSKTLVLINVHPDNTHYHDYSSMEAKDRMQANAHQGPILFEPNGKRFSVFGQKIMYGKWNFSYHMRPSTGLMLFDVKFSGARKAYEISLQEALVFYSGHDPAHSTLSSSDMSRLFGASTVELVRGVDCPETALFINTDIWTSAGKAETIKNNICIFENTNGKPLRRHYARKKNGTFSFYGGIPDYHLVIRCIATVSNTDYVLDYVFRANGEIEVRSFVTGYVQGTFLLPEEQNYGSILHNHVVANANQHVLNYKVDLDIAGVDNRYSTLKLGVTTVEHVWPEDMNKTQMELEHTLISNETHFKENEFDFKNAIYHLFHNTNARQVYGSDRAYRIVNKSPISVFMANDQICSSFKWTSYPLIVTKRKETELISTSVYAMRDTLKPIVDFEDFVDGDNLVDEDLVAWVTVGTTHIPRTEDVPGTPTSTNEMSFVISPHNYFTECPAISSSDNVFIRHDARGEPEVNTYGRSYSAHCVPKLRGPYAFESDSDS